MRPLVAVLAVPLRRLSGSDNEPDQTEPSGEVDDRAEKLRRAKQRSESDETPVGNRSVPDEGVVCADDGTGYLFSTAADTEVHEFANTSVTEVTSGEWIKSEAAVDVEGWA